MSQVCIPVVYNRATIYGDVTSISMLLVQRSIYLTGLLLACFLVE